MSVFAKPELILEKLRREYQFGLQHIKEAGTGEKSYSLAGELYLSDSGWLLLRVPNSLARGLFDSLDDPGLELPLKNGRLNAHITVMSPDEIASIGGSGVISERGHHYHYTLGPVKTVKPAGWDDVGLVYYVTVDSPDLRNLRKSYGLEPLRRGYDHHITFAVKRKAITQNNDKSKVDHSKATETVAKAASVNMAMLGLLDDVVMMNMAKRNRMRPKPRMPIPTPTAAIQPPQPPTSPDEPTAEPKPPGLLQRAGNWVRGLMPAQPEVKVAASHHTAVIEIPRRGQDDHFLCPHCGKALLPKDIYTDKKGWTFCRKCLLKGKGSITIPDKLSRFAIKAAAPKCLVKAAVEYSTKGTFHPEPMRRNMSLAELLKLREAGTPISTPEVVQQSTPVEGLPVAKFAPPPSLSGPYVPETPPTHKLDREKWLEKQRATSYAGDAPQLPFDVKQPITYPKGGKVDTRNPVTIPIGNDPAIHPATLPPLPPPKAFAAPAKATAPKIQSPAATRPGIRPWVRNSLLGAGAVGLTGAGLYGLHKLFSRRDNKHNGSHE